MPYCNVILRWRRWLLCALCVAWLSPQGCALFQETKPFSTTDSLEQTLLKPAKTSLEMVQLEIITIERAADDPLIRESLWREVDQIASLSSESRSVLRKNGFKVGLVGTSPPLVLQTLMKVHDTTAELRNGETPEMAGRRVVVRPGSETPVVVGAWDQDAQIDWHDGDKDHSVNLPTISTIFLIRTERSQDGWLTLDFSPELQHGETQLRPTATDTGWQLQGRKNVKTFPGLRFSMKANIGESVLISQEGDLATSLGHWFFNGFDADGRPVRRLLLIRLANMSRLDPIFAKQ